MKSILKKIFVLPILFYQYSISPLIPSSCRFTPTCSHYAKDAIMKHGIIKGFVLEPVRLFGNILHAAKGKLGNAKKISAAVHIKPLHVQKKRGPLSLIGFGLNMAKVSISSDEFRQITLCFKAPKEGEHICWRDFVDHVD